MYRRALLCLAMLLANFRLTDALTNRQRNLKRAEIEAYDFSPYLGSTGKLDGTTLVGPEIVEWMGFVGVSKSLLDLTVIETAVMAVDWTTTWIDYTSVNYFFEDVGVPMDAVDWELYELLMTMLGVNYYDIDVTTIYEFLDLV